MKSRVFCLTVVVLAASSVEAGATSPADQAMRFLEAVRDGDFRTAYEACEKARIELEEITNQHPNVLWDKKMDEHFQEWLGDYRQKTLASYMFDSSGVGPRPKRPDWGLLRRLLLPDHELRKCSKPAPFALQNSSAKTWIMERRARSCI